MTTAQAAKQFHLTAPDVEQPRIESSVFARARTGNKDALEELFRSFITVDNEEILHVEYLGVKGIWRFGQHSFGCVTNRRVADITYSPLFKEMIYQDGYLEHVNSGVILQPSRFWLYLLWFILLLFSVFSLLYVLADYWMSFGTKFFLSMLIVLGTLLLLPVITRFFYTINKCGLVFWVREGVAVYMYTNHNRFNRARSIYKIFSEGRENRIQQIHAL